jgi:hypothetical protein
VRRIGAGCGSDGEAPRLTGPRGARVHGFSLHAQTAMPAHRRAQLAQLIRDTARGAVSLARLQEETTGDLVYPVTPPWSDGTTGMRLAPRALLAKRAALVPLPHVHLGRSGGCLAPHRHRRRALLPTPRQPGLDEPEACPPAPRWRWARLRQRVFALELARCPWGQQGRLRRIAVITPGEVIRTILRHLQRTADPPPIAPACARHEIETCDEAHTVMGVVEATCVPHTCLAPEACGTPVSIAPPVPPKTLLRRRAPALAGPYHALPCRGLLQRGGGKSA